VTIVTSLRELAKDARLSPCQVHRALRRLEGAHLILWERDPGRGKKSRITLLWRHRVIHSPEEQQGEEATSQQENRNVSSHARDTLSPSEKKRKSHSGCAFDRPLGSQALAWAMAQVRNDLIARPSISPARRAVILAALGPAVHRALRSGRVRTRGELARLVGFLLARLEERRGLGVDLPATRRWAEWAVREGLRAVSRNSGSAGRPRRNSSGNFCGKPRKHGGLGRSFWKGAKLSRRSLGGIIGAMSLSPEEREKLRSALLNWVRVCRQKYPAVEPGELRAMWNEAVQEVFRAKREGKFPEQKLKGL
jgi:hypothetical protein